MSIARWQQRDAAAVWHPFTQHSVWLDDDSTLLRTLSVGSPGVRKGAGQSLAERAAEVVVELETVVAEHGDAVCALVIEPMMQGAGGMLIHHPDFVRACRRVADHYRTRLICDEVATGIGRTGRMWACEHASVSPDLLVCGKGLTGGQCGAMVGVEVYSLTERTGFGVCQAARRRGVWLRPLGDVVVLMPPLTLGEAETKLLTDALLAALDDVTRSIV